MYVVVVAGLFDGLAWRMKKMKVPQWMIIFVRRQELLQGEDSQSFDANGSR